MPSHPLGPVLETERLILRPPNREDYDPFMAFSADPEVAKFLGGVPAPNAAWRTIRSMAGGWALDGFAMFSVIEKSTGRWIGRVGPFKPWGWPGTEVGWGLVRDVWGKGYATESAIASMDWAIATLGWTEVIHCIVPENVGSQNVARRLGGVNRGPGKLPAPYAEAPVEIWGQSAEEWKARRARGEPKR